MRMRTSIRAARARIIGAIFVTIAHQIRAFCLPVSFRPLRDFLPIGFHPPFPGTSSTAVSEQCSWGRAAKGHLELTGNPVTSRYAAQG